MKHIFPHEIVAHPSCHRRRRRQSDWVQTACWCLTWVWGSSCSCRGCCSVWPAKCCLSPEETSTPRRREQRYSSASSRSCPVLPGCQRTQCDSSWLPRCHTLPTHQRTQSNHSILSARIYCGQTIRLHSRLERADIRFKTLLSLLSAVMYT